MQSLLEVTIMSTKRVNTSNQPVTKAIAKVLRAIPGGAGVRTLPLIRRATLDQQAAVLARLGVIWYDDAGVGHDIGGMGEYKPTGTDPIYELIDYPAVPDNSLVEFYLDVSVVGIINIGNVFVYRSTVMKEADFFCNGTAFGVNFQFVGISDVGAEVHTSKKK